jgi:hypothetical protein
MASAWCCGRTIERCGKPSAKISSRFGTLRISATYEREGHAASAESASCERATIAFCHVSNCVFFFFFLYAPTTTRWIDKEFVCLFSVTNLEKRSLLSIVNSHHLRVRRQPSRLHVPTPPFSLIPLFSMAAWKQLDLCSTCSPAA